VGLFHSEEMRGTIKGAKTFFRYLIGGSDVAAETEKKEGGDITDND